MPGASEINVGPGVSGPGGIVLGGFLRPMIIALDRGDLAKLPFSDDVDKDSRLLMRPNVREGKSSLAPFLTYEPDPNIVLGDDGRLAWVLDAFTVSNSYPYSTHYCPDRDLINYMPNMGARKAASRTTQETFFIDRYTVSVIETCDG